MTKSHHHHQRDHHHQLHGHDGNHDHCFTATFLITLTVATISKTTEAINLIFIAVVIIITGRTEQNEMQYSRQCNYGVQKITLKEQLSNCGELASTNRIAPAWTADQLTLQRLNSMRKFWQLNNVLKKTIHQMLEEKWPERKNCLKHGKWVQMINTLDFCTSKSKWKARKFKKETQNKETIKQ